MLTRLPLRPPASAPARLSAIDWMRGLVMLLMVVDHASSVLNPGRLVMDTVWRGGLGANLTPDGTPWQFLVRWMTHLCAPTFVFLAGTALALSSARRRAEGVPWRDIDRHVLVRGLIIIALELWMALAFGVLIFQVLFALGASMVCMTLLRRVPSRWLLVGSVAWILGYEAVVTALGIRFDAPTPAWAGPVLAPHAGPNFIFGLDGGFVYPLLGWLPIMVLGWVYGGHVQTRRSRILPLLVGAGIAFAVFAVQRSLNAYGNFGLSRTDDSMLRWLQVNKYPPSLAYVALELGLLGLLLALATRLRPGRRNPLLVFGQTALFFYVLHLHLLRLVGIIATGGYGKPAWGLAPTFLAAVGVAAVLYPLCRWYRGFKSRNPTSLARYL